MCTAIATLAAMRIAAGGRPALLISAIRQYAASRLRTERSVSNSGKVRRFSMSCACSCGEQLGVTSEPQRQGLVVCERRRHQITKSERAQQAPSHPAGERIAGAGQNRQPRPQRVTCGRMGVAGEGVQEKISETIPGEMLGQGLQGAKMGRAGAMRAPRPRA